MKFYYWPLYALPASAAAHMLSDRRRGRRRGGAVWRVVLEIMNNTKTSSLSPERDKGMRSMQETYILSMRAGLWDIIRDLYPQVLIVTPALRLYRVVALFISQYSCKLTSVLLNLCMCTVLCSFSHMYTLLLILRTSVVVSARLLSRVRLRAPAVTCRVAAGLICSSERRQKAWHHEY